MSGTAFTTQPAVELRDGTNAVVPQSGTTITAAIASGTGVLSGTLTATTDANGKATFTNLAITGTGAHTLTFTSGALTAATSASFTVTAGAPTQLAVTTQPGGGVSGVALTTQPVVAIRDAGGNATTSTANVTAAIASGSGTLSGTTTVAAVNGVATFTNLVVTGTGAHTITFTSGGLTSATSASFTVTAGAPTQLVMVTQPAGATSGAAFTTQPAVELRDASNAVVLQSGVTVTVAKASGTGTLSGTLTATTDASGKATFTNLVITGTGPHTLTFTSGALTAATSASFAVTASAPTQLAVTTQPGGGVSGAALTTQPVVAIRDAGGNATTSTANVTAAIASGSGTLSGTTTVAAVNGVATFTNLVITGTGPHTLTFTSSGLTAATSSSFSVTAGTPTQLVVVTQPGGAVSGTALVTQPAVELRDGSNAVVPQSGVTVTVTRASGAGTLSGTLTATTDAAGKATFANLVITGGGAHTLAFSATGLTGATSASFDVTEADLVAGTVTVSPANPLNTQPVTVNAIASNTGNATAFGVAWQIKIDGAVLGSGTIASLAAGASTTVTASNLGPFGLGSHTAQLVLDPSNTIAEANEGNNTSSQPFTSNTLQTSDLVAGAVTVTPTNPLTTQRVTVSAAVSNAGNVTAQNVEWQLKVDGAVLESGVIASLDAGASTTVSGISVKPYAQGAHTAQLVLDPANKILESSESNNVSSRAFTSSSSQTADLAAGVVTVTPANPLPTQPIAITAVVSNEGNAVANNVAWQLRVDGALVASGAIPSLAVGATATVSTANAGTYAAGQHVAEVLFDPANEIIESSEVNNTSAQAFTVSPPATVDLVAGVVTVTPANPLTTQPVALIAEVRNAGTGSATNVAWQLLIDGAVVRSGTIANLAVGAMTTVSASNLGPYGAGQHTAQLVLDPANAIAESSETNNSSTRAFTASVFGTVDLESGAVTVTPTSPLPTQLVSLSAGLSNTGSATAANVAWQLKVDGTVVSSGTIESLAAGENATVVASNVGPYPLGGHTAQLVLDPANTIAESSEANNTSSQPFTVVAPPPRLVRIAIAGVAGRVVRVSNGATLCELVAGGPQIVCTVELPITEKVAAVPAPTSGFTGWSGACTGRGSCSIAVNETQELLATFVPVRPIDANVAAQDLLTGTGLSLIDRETLDRTGNADGVYNLGDLLAHVERTGQSLSAEMSARLLSAPNTLSRPIRAARPLSPPSNP